MTAGPQTGWLPDGRLHLNHGPIDLIVEAWGARSEMDAGYVQAIARFQAVLTELVTELPALRRPASVMPRRFEGAIAQAMEDSVSRLAGFGFITPMAAVAGSVADAVLEAMIVGRKLDKASVNNGGDIALWIGPGQCFDVAIAGTGHGFADRIAITHDSPVRGIATSGWRGRSFSLGIADAVTVLARTAAEADAAATLIANAVDLPGHRAVERQPARELAPDSDLGGRLVTVGVGRLTVSEVDEALARGSAVAKEFAWHGLIEGAALFLGGQSRTIEPPAVRHSTLPPSGLPAISPARGEIRPTSTVATSLISTLAGEMAGRPEGGVKMQTSSRARGDTLHA